MIMDMQQGLTGYEGGTSVDIRVPDRCLESKMQGANRTSFESAHTTDECKLLT
jgi:hypothetical protein